MATALQATIGATTYSLSASPYWRVRMQGIGTAEINRIEERGPGADGVVDLGWILQARTMQFEWIVQQDGASLANLDTFRDTLVNVLRPRLNTPILFTFTRDDGAQRSIYAYLTAQMDLPHYIDDRMGASQKVLAQFRCPDPLFFNPSLQNLTVANISTAGFRIPMVIPWIEVASSFVYTIGTIAYAGNYKEYPIIYITGPAVNPIVTNLTTDETLDFTGTTISSGDVYTIDLRKDKKTIVNSAGTNKIADLVAGSDLGVWHLDPDLSDGNNDIKMEVTSGATSVTAIRIEYYNRYLQL